MPVLGQRTFIIDPTTDKYISLANEEFTREVDLTGYGNGWSKIRIALNLAIVDTGGGNFSNSFLAVGLSAGTTNPYGVKTTTNFVGHVFGHESSCTWTRNAGAGNPYYTVNNFYIIRKVGVTELRANSGAMTPAIPATGGTLSRRGWLGTTISQTSTQAVVTGQAEAVATATVDTGYNQFLYSTNQGATPFVLETTVATQANTITPGAGWNSGSLALNTLDIFWSNATYPVEIYAMILEFTP